MVDPPVCVEVAPTADPCANMDMFIHDSIRKVNTLSKYADYQHQATVRLNVMMSSAVDFLEEVLEFPE